MDSDGRGSAVVARSSTAFSQMVVKVRPDGRRPSGNTLAVAGLGTQVLDQETSGAKALSVRLRWEKVAGSYVDGARYELRKPVVTVAAPGGIGGRIRTSLRMSPPLIGLGLLESVPWESLAALSVAPDARASRISGRLRWVRDEKTGQLSVGRFRFKATQPTVEQQTAAAPYHDMQISNPIYNDGEGLPEASQGELTALTVYRKLSLCERGSARRSFSFFDRCDEGVPNLGCSREGVCFARALSFSQRPRGAHLS